MKKRVMLFACILLAGFSVFSQNVGSSPDYIIALTSEWKGERFTDGRQKVSDALLDRLRNISIEEALGVLRNRGYQNQFEGVGIYKAEDGSGYPCGCKSA